MRRSLRFLRRRTTILIAVLGPSGILSCDERRGTDDLSGGSGATMSLIEPPAFTVTEGTGQNGTRPFTILSLSHALPLANGLIVVANRTELIYLDSAGRAVAIAGRRGNGPGEFVSMRTLFETPDGVGVFDASQGRVTVYSPSGEFVRDVRVEPGLYPAAPGWLRSEGPVTSAAPPGEPRRYTVRDTSGNVVRTFESPVRTPTFNVTWQRETGRQGRASPWIECQPAELAGVVGDVLYVTDQTAGHVIALASDGSQRIVYRSPRRRMVTDTIVALLRRGYEGDSTPREVMDSVLDRFGTTGDSLPFAWERLLVDPTGRLWLLVAECLPPAEREWEVIDTSGALIGRVRVRNRALRGVRADRVVALTSDSVDVIYANLFRLRPDGRP